MKRFLRALAFVAGAVLVIVASLRIGYLSKKLVQTVEADGFRQREYRVFGAIPTTEAHWTPGLVVKPDILAAISKEVALPPGMDLRSCRNASVIRRDGEIEYFVQMPFHGDTAGTIALFFRQVTKPVQCTRDDVRGLTREGSTLSVSIFSRLVPKPGGPVPPPDSLDIELTKPCSEPLR